MLYDIIEKKKASIKMKTKLNINYKLHFDTAIDHIIKQEIYKSLDDIYIYPNKEYSIDNIHIDFSKSSNYIPTFSMSRANIYNRYNLSTYVLLDDDNIYITSAKQFFLYSVGSIKNKDDIDVDLKDYFKFVDSMNSIYLNLDNYKIDSKYNSVRKYIQIFNVTRHMFYKGDPDVDTNGLYILNKDPLLFGINKIGD